MVRGQSHQLRFDRLGMSSIHTLPYARKRTGGHELGKLDYGGRFPESQTSTCYQAALPIFKKTSTGINPPTRTHIAHLEALLLQ
jgi:hypothetical protein